MAVAASYEDIASNNFSLGVSHYVKQKWRVAERPLDEIYAERLATEMELEKISRQINEELKALVQHYKD
jgi:hypothetical protein